MNGNKRREISPTALDAVRAFQHGFDGIAPRPAVVENNCIFEYISQI
jgi:hypothetical protein